MAYQALALITAPAASAATTCSISSGTLSVTMVADGDAAVIQVGASDQIFVNAGACGGIALLSNTSQITVNGGAGDQTVEVHLDDVAGDIVDWGAINWTLVGGGDGASGDNLRIVDQSGTSDPVDITAGASGIDLDTDGDLDVVQSGFENFTFEAAPGGGNVINLGGDTTTGAAFPSDVQGDAGNGCAGFDGMCANGGADENVFTGGAGDDTMITNGADTFAGGLGDDTIDGAAGSTVDYSAATAAVNVDLTAGLGTGQGSDSLSAGIDNVIGSPQGDTLNGDAADNTFTPSAGDDKIDGKAGEDTADFSDSAAGVTVDLDAGTATGDGTDTLSNIEDVQGSDLADTITGDIEDNALFGGAGNDAIDGGDGSDTIDGESGSDWVDYSSRTDAVTADLTKGNVPADATPGSCNDAVEFVSGNADDGAGDCLNAIENAALGSADDTFVGNAFNNTVQPGGGSNSLTGGGGSDTVDYSVGYTAGVTVNLAGGSASDDAFTDGSFVNVIGTTFTDNITGSDGSNTLKSRAGKDNVRGGAGDDTIKAGAGADRVRAGSGDDDLWGQKGNDYLNGGSGADFCKGGPGKDTLVSC